MVLIFGVGGQNTAQKISRDHARYCSEIDFEIHPVEVPKMAI